METKKQNYTLPIIVMIFLFGMISFVTNLASPMGDILKYQFNVPNWMGTLGVFANRMSKLLFNLTVEHNITNHLLAADVDMTREEYNKLRGGSVREVTSTRGMPRI